MSEFVVYRIINSINGKEYIGSTINFKKRINSHLSQLRKNNHHSFYLQNAFNKYGEDSFSFEIIKTFNNRVDMISYEEFLLEDIDDKYNVSKKACGGDLISYHPKLEEIRKKHYDNYYKIKELNYGTHPLSLIDVNGENNPNWRGGSSQLVRCLDCNINYVSPYKSGCCNKCSKKGILNGFYGKTHSKESKLKMKLNHKHTLPSNTIPVVIDGVKYESATKASKIYNCCHTTILNRCRSNLFPNYLFYKGELNEK